MATGGVSRSLSLIVAGSSTNASFGCVSLVLLNTVTQSGAGPWALVATQPAGSAGAVTPSKFSPKTAQFPVGWFVSTPLALTESTDASAVISVSQSENVSFQDVFISCRCASA